MAAITLVQKASAVNATTIPGGDLGPGTRWMLEISASFASPVTAGNLVQVTVSATAGSTGSPVDLSIGPGPSGAFINATSGGALAPRTVYAMLTFTDSAGRETAAGPEYSQAIGSGQLAAFSPPNPNLLTLPAGCTWNVYAAYTSGHETLQATGQSASATWTEPAGGFSSTGAVPPTKSLYDSLGTNYTMPLFRPYNHSSASLGLPAICFFWAVMSASGANTLTFVCGAGNGNPFVDNAAEMCISIAEYAGFVAPSTQAVDSNASSNAALAFAETDSQAVSVTTTFPLYMFDRTAAVLDIRCGGAATADFWIAVSCNSTPATPTVSYAGVVYTPFETLSTASGRTCNIYTFSTPFGVHLAQRGNIDWDQTGLDARQGQNYGLKFQYADGTFTLGNLPKFLPDGTLTDSGVAAAAAGGGAPQGEVPAGTMNGTNTSFTLAHAPNPANSLELYLNGVEQIPGTDYTLAGNTITYTVPPKSSDWQMAWYSTSGTGGGGGGSLDVDNVLPIRTVAANTTMTNSDYTVVAIVPSITVTLPAAPVLGQLMNVKNGNTTVGMLITVSSGSSVLIDQAATLSMGATASLSVQWDGAQWRIL